MESGTNLGPQFTYADNFYFEVWQGSNTGGHVRIDKFRRVIVNESTKLKIWPAHRINSIHSLHLNTSSKEFVYFVKVMSVGFNIPLIRSLVFFMRTQFTDSCLFPEQMDIQNFCTAFQCLLEITDKQDVGKVLAEKLIAQFTLPQDITEELRKWMEDLYAVRSIFTHGGELHYDRLSYKGQRHIGLARIVFQLLVLKLINPETGSIYDGFLVRQIAVATNKIFKTVVNVFSKNQAKEKLIGFPEEKLQFIGGQVRDYVGLDTRLVTFDNRKKLYRALVTLLYLFEHMYYTLESNAELREQYQAAPLNNIKACMDCNTKAGVMDVEAVINELPANNFALDCTELADGKKEVTFRGIITLSGLLDAFAKIQSVYKGYNKL